MRPRRPAAPRIAEGRSDHTVMTISGHSSTRMLERYVHPDQTLRTAPLETGSIWSQTSHKTRTTGTRQPTR
jgi:hypothetical protein